MKTESLQKLILDHQDQIMTSLQKTINPIFNYENDFEKYESYLNRYIQFSRPLLPKQAECTAAIESYFKSNKSCIASLDTGFGKTTVSIAIASKAEYKNIYIVSPPHLVGKWRREIHTVLGIKNFDYKIIIVNSYVDVINLTKKGSKNTKKTFYIVSKNKNSSTYTKKNLVLKYKKYASELVEVEGESSKKRKTVFTGRLCCPICYSTVVSSSKYEKYITNSRKIKNCNSCHNYLKEPNQHRISPAEFIQRYSVYKAIDLLIIDEIHEEKSRTTLRGKALGQLIPKSKKVIGLTGTFLGGYASHVYSTLFQMFPLVFKNQFNLNWQDEKEFISKFGGTEYSKKIVEVNGKLLETGGKKHKERAELSPKLLNFLLPMVLFGKLDEMKYFNDAAKLPSYTEFSHVVTFENEFKDIYLEYINKLAEEYKLSKGKNKRIIFQKMKLDSLLIPDMPYANQVLRVNKKIIRYTPNVDRSKLVITNKERKLLEIITKSMKHGKKCLVYYDFVNTTLSKDLLRMIESNTEYSVGTLTSNVESKNREDYINELECDILLTNPELVKTGLDLIAFPTIIFYQQSYINLNVFTIRQAAKRAWRIGQTQDCEVHSIVYSATAQAKVLELIASKINISQGVEGRLSTGTDLASEAEDENIQIEMAKAILSKKFTKGRIGTKREKLVQVSREWNTFEQHYINKLEGVPNDIAS